MSIVPAIVVVVAGCLTADAPIEARIVSKHRYMILPLLNNITGKALLPGCYHRSGRYWLNQDNSCIRSTAQDYQLVRRLSVSCSQRR